MLYLPGDGTVVDGSPADVLATSAIAPPIVELGRLAGWRPLPLSVRDARRRAAPLRDRLAGLSPPTRPPASDEPRLTARGVVVRYGDLVAVNRVDLDLRRGEVVALMGRNGSGKSSLLWALQGAGARQRGTVDVDGVDPARLAPSAARRLVGMVPQTPSDLLYLDTVAAECAAADREASVSAGTCRALLDRLAPGIPDDRHPRDLSEGQRLSLVLAVQLTAAPSVMLLDEPTRGLDYPTKKRFADIVRDLAGRGTAVMIATHDVELVASLGDRVVVMAQGEVVADGPTAEIVVASPTFAPQTAKILHPLPWLTAADVAEALR
jgi:energy-coupling factor transport system ATP-binding protein